MQDAITEEQFEGYAQGLGPSFKKKAEIA